VKNIVFLLVIAGGILYGMFNYHFILLDKNVKVLKKAQTTLEYTFVDARGANKAKLFLTPALVNAGIKDALREAGN